MGEGGIVNEGVGGVEIAKFCADGEVNHYVRRLMHCEVIRSKRINYYSIIHGVLCEEWGDLSPAP